MKFSIGFSPCPNDTFIFDQLINNPPEGIEWDLHLEDVETLNEWAILGKLDITKLSFATYLKVKDIYDLLPAGAALGKGVGPILVTKSLNKFDSHDSLYQYLQNKTVAIPGIQTTANLLFSAAFPSVKNKLEKIFSDIEEAIINNEVDAGLLIHESRFTYQEKDLHKLIDLGEWWEQNHASAIPLGGIVIKKNLSPVWKAQLTTWIQKSLKNSWDQFPNLSSFITDNAQEMDPNVMLSHIELYVNDETMELSQSGIEAINTLEKAYQEMKDQL